MPTLRYPRSEPESTDDDAPAEDSASPSSDAPFPYGGSRRGDSIALDAAAGVLPAPDGSAGRSGSTTCPACDGETVNGAGLFTCVDCDWIGRLR